MIGKEEFIKYDWQPLSERCPTESDFGSGLDERSAWREFGGLSLDQAYQHFLENPLSYQEDFMFMGTIAFLYYFPVIERYLYSVRAEDEFDDCQAWILSMGIAHRLEYESFPNDERLMERIALLTDHVLSHVSQYATTSDEQERIESSWASLKQIPSTR